jgi:hypothetical protein
VGSRWARCQDQLAHRRLSHAWNLNLYIWIWRPALIYRFRNLKLGSDLTVHLVWEGVSSSTGDVGSYVIIKMYFLYPCVGGKFKCARIYTGLLFCQVAYARHDALWLLDLWNLLARPLYRFVALRAGAETVSLSLWLWFIKYCDMSTHCQATARWTPRIHARNNGTTGLCNPILGNGSVNTLPRRRNDITSQQCWAITWLVYSV